MQTYQTNIRQSPARSAKSREPAGRPSDALTDAFRLLGAAVRFERDAKLQAEGAPADCFYQVISGAVRTYRLLGDGRRQINAFHLPGNVIELEATRNHRFTAEAVTNSLIRVATRAAIIDRAAHDHELATEIWRRTADNLQCAQEHMLMLGRKSAEERIAGFLLEMANRSVSEPSVELPMSRQDIADYVGLSIETVSRTLTHLENTSTIDLPSSRRVRLCNRAELQRLNA